MIQLLATYPLLFFIIFPGLLLAITIHEFAHALVADKLGDPTPRYQGRITLNPLAHLDPVGTLAILLTRFGWGKPVIYDPYNLKEPVRDAALIALAGPVSNLLVAVLISIVIHFLVLPQILTIGLVQVMVINIALAIFNLIPIHPLDGGKILLSILPRATALEYEAFMNRYSTLVLILLILPIVNGISPASQLITPAIDLLVNMLLW